jgi:DNA invertase Pin-like site-specific DNA recombinase
VGKKLVAYLSVSSHSRFVSSSLSLNEQRRLLRKYANDNQLDIIAEFAETERGVNSKITELKKALSTCSENKAKLIIARLDCLPQDAALMARIVLSGTGWIAVEQSRTDDEILAAIAEYWR